MPTHPGTYPQLLQILFQPSQLLLGLFLPLPLFGHFTHETLDPSLQLQTKRRFHQEEDFSGPKWLGLSLILGPLLRPALGSQRVFL